MKSWRKVQFFALEEPICVPNSLVDEAECAFGFVNKRSGYDQATRGTIVCRAFSMIFLYFTRFEEFSVELIPFAFYTKLRQMNVTMRRIWSRVRMKWKRGTVEM